MSFYTIKIVKSVFIPNFSYVTLSSNGHSTFGGVFIPAASHKGAIAFGLVYILVNLYNAVSDGGVSFNQLDRESGARIKYKKVRADTGEEVKPESIVKGYQYEKGRYVVLTDKEIERMKTPRDRAITILHFAAKDSVDPIFFEKCYYAIPDRSDKAFALLREGMLRENVVAIAKTVIGTKETLMMLYSHNDGILADTLHYQHEIKAIPKPYLHTPVVDAELNMAVMLIQNMTAPFKPKHTGMNTKRASERRFRQRYGDRRLW